MIDHWERHNELGTRKTAIHAMCCDCMGWEQGEKPPRGVTALIRNCETVACPLWTFRPYKKSDSHGS